MSLLVRLVRLVLVLFVPLTYAQDASIDQTVVYVTGGGSRARSPAMPT